MGKIHVYISLWKHKLLACFKTLHREKMKHVPHVKKIRIKIDVYVK